MLVCTPVCIPCASAPLGRAPCAHPVLTACVPRAYHVHTTCMPSAPDTLHHACSTAPPPPTRAPDTLHPLAGISRWRRWWRGTRASCTRCRSSRPLSSRTNPSPDPNPNPNPNPWRRLTLTLTLSLSLTLTLSLTLSLTLTLTRPRSSRTPRLETTPSDYPWLGSQVGSSSSSSTQRRGTV